MGSRYTTDSRGVIVGSQGMVVPITNGSLGSPRLDSGTSGLNAVACLSVTACEAVGQLAGQGVGAVVPISNVVPGATQAVPGTFALSGVACSGSTTCETVGYGRASAGSGLEGVVVLIDSGVPRAAQAVPETYQLLGLACLSANACEAVGQSPSTQAASGEGAVVTISAPCGALGGAPQPGRRVAAIVRRQSRKRHRRQCVLDAAGLHRHARLGRR